MEDITLVWLRRDLRLDDQAALYYALKNEQNVLPLFIFDTTILNLLDSKEDRRVDFIYQVLSDLKEDLDKLASTLLVEYGDPIGTFKKLFSQFRIKAIYTNHDYEPKAIFRDEQVKKLAEENNISFKSFKDQCIFEKQEVVKDDGSPYSVFTPYSRKWKARLNAFYIKSYPCKKYYRNLYKGDNFEFPSLASLGFEKTDISFEKFSLSKTLIQTYHQARDFPALPGTSRVSVHLRFGTVSIRKLVAYAAVYNETYLNELIWRDFYMMILYHYPNVVNHAFKTDYDHILWRNNEEEFKAWCEGKTGYPIVDAGMRELNAMGFMHNRVRMITASFLTKHLLIDWRWGEAYFATKLNDYDLSANNGGWQWAASTGCDAVPYFRIFNPAEQAKRFDPERIYIKKWVQEIDTPAYPQPIVEHQFARQRALDTYKQALANK